MSLTVSNDKCGMGCANCKGKCSMGGLGGLGADFSFMPSNYPSSMPNDPVVTGNGTPLDMFSELWDSLSPSNMGSGGSSWSMFDNVGGWDSFNTGLKNANNPNIGAFNNNAGGSGLWQTLLAGTASTFNSIARSRYGVPPPGTLITQGPYGTNVQTLPVGATSGFNLNGVNASGFAGLSLTSLLLIGGGLFLVTRMMGK